MRAPSPFDRAPVFLRRLVVRVFRLGAGAGLPRARADASEEEMSRIADEIRKARAAGR